MEQTITKNILPETGFLRLRNILGDPKANPPIPAIIPVSRSSWYAGIQSGLYPPGLKIGPRITVWRVEDIRAFIENSPELSQEILMERNG